MPVQLIRGSSGGSGGRGIDFSRMADDALRRQSLRAEELRRQGAFELDQQIRQGRLDAQATEFQQERVSQDFNAQSLAAMYERLDPQLQPQAEILAGALSSGMDAAEGEARIQGLFAQNEALRMERFRQEGAERILRLAENAGGEQEIPELAELAEGVAQGFIDPQKGVQQAEKFAAAAAQKQAFEIRRQEGVAMLDGLRQMVPQVSQELASIAALGASDPDLGYKDMVRMAGKAMLEYAKDAREDLDPATNASDMDAGLSALRQGIGGQPMQAPPADPQAPGPEAPAATKESLPEQGTPQAQELQAAGAQAAARGEIDEYFKSMGYADAEDPDIPEWLLFSIVGMVGAQVQNNSNPEGFGQTPDGRTLYTPQKRRDGVQPATIANQGSTKTLDK